MASGADRAKASRIRSKGASASADEKAWLDDFERRRAKPDRVETRQRSEPVKDEPNKVIEVEPEPITETLPPIVEPPPDVDTGVEIDELLTGEPDRVIFYDDEKPAPVVKSEEAKITGFIATSTASSVFLMNKTAWSIFGDREHVEPTTEEMELMTKVIGSYAERYGWTRELDDALLLGTVLIAYNARCYRAPKKGQ